MALSSLQVLGGSGIVAVLTAVGAWGPADEPRPWTQTRPGDPYRHAATEVKAPATLSVHLVAACAWAVVAVSALRALVLMLEIVAQETTTVTSGGGDCATFPCEQTPSEIIHSFDVRSALLYGLYLIATGAVIGAFARWARDAARDRNQALRAAPLVAGGAIVVVALGIGPLCPHYLWAAGLVHAGVVLTGTVLLAVARRSARDAR